MAETKCKCGCGEDLALTNKNGFKWGHKTKGKIPATPPQSGEVEVAAADEPAVESIDCSMSRSQLDRIWHSLDLRTAAVAILTALNE